MTINELPLLAAALLIFSLLLFAGMTWLQTCKGSYRVPLKLSSNGSLPTKLGPGRSKGVPNKPTPPPPPPKKYCGNCSSCKCVGK